MVDQIKYDLIATDKASANIAKVRKETERLSKQANVTAGSARNLSNSTSGMGRSAGMAGIQVQQLVGQVTAGTNPLIAFSQQATDLGFVLGVPLAGAIVGIAASIGTVLLPAIFEADEAFAEFSRRIKSITQDFKVINEETKAELIRKQTDEVKKAGKAFADQEAEVEKLEQGLAILQQRLQRLPGEQIVLNREIARFEKNIESAKTKAAELSLVADDQARKLAELKNELGGVARNQVEVTATGITTTKVITRGNLALEREAAIIREQVKPAIQVFFDAKKRLQFLESEGLLTTEEVIERTKQLTEAYEKSTASVDKAKESVDFYNISMKEVKRDGLKSLEDGLVGLITQTQSVSEAFRNMATSIINDLARMAIRQAITIPLAESMGLSVGERALGGSMTANKPYLVGERGPELVIPRGGSDVVPNNRLSGGSPVNITLNVSTGVSATVRQEMQEMLPRIAEVAKSAVQNAQMRRRM